jgi:branched-chain amino acid transport system substrate-binding protein
MGAVKQFRLTVLLVAALAALSGCAPSLADPVTTSDGKTPVNVGIITSTTGPLAAFGEQYTEGFKAGLDYATGGAGTVDGREITVTWEDDQGNPDTAVSKAKNLIGQGYQILAGTVVSSIATALAEQAAQNRILYIAGPAGADIVTGLNKYTFRSGRQIYQDVATAATFIGTPAGMKILVFAQDTAYGQSYLSGVSTFFGSRGATVEGVLVAEDATEFTPFAQQIAQAEAGLLFVAWPGATSAAMWAALEEQSVLDDVAVVSAMGDRAAHGGFGPQSDRIGFLSHYFPAATDNAVSRAMIQYLEAHQAEADLFSPDGFVAAQMVVRAIEEGGDVVDDMISALEGWTFDSVKGSLTIRMDDHALIQPMFQARLRQDAGGTWFPELVHTVDARTVAPPVDPQP